jgi:hypothetical protein
MAVHWNTESFISNWVECATADDWGDFSGAMLQCADCPPDYSDSDLRRQTGLTRYQLNNKGYAAPSEHKAPKKKKKPGIESIASKLGLKKN